MFRLTYEPIIEWPDGWVRGQRAPHWSPFRASWHDTLDILSREVWALRGAHVRVEIDVDERLIRPNGTLPDGAIVGYHGCILRFDSHKWGPMTFTCDEYELAVPRHESWRHNLRAIALGLEALRKVDRYGISKDGQQYAGWSGLPLEIVR